MALAFHEPKIEALKTKLTCKEARQWRSFFRMYPFDDEHRYHRAGAMNAYVTSKVNGGKSKLQDFMPFGHGGGFDEVVKALEAT